MSDLMRLYNTLSTLPLGRELMRIGISRKAPYFSTIRPKVKDLAPGHCAIEMKDRRAVRNHLGTIHAIAMCNLCELTMGLAVDAAMSRDLRWIAKGMEVQYKKIARGTLTATCTVPAGDFSPGELSIPVTVKNLSDETVTQAAISIHISRRPRTSSEKREQVR